MLKCELVHQVMEWLERLRQNPVVCSIVALVHGVREPPALVYKLCLCTWLDASHSLSCSGCLTTALLQGAGSCSSPHDVYLAIE